MEIKVCDNVTKEILGVTNLKLKDFKDQQKLEKVYSLKPTTGPENMGDLRIRIRVLWSKLLFFQSSIIVAEEKLKMAHKETEDLNRFLKLLDEPFGIVIHGEINNIIDNDVLEVPKDKEEIVEKKRMSVLPQASTFQKNPNAVSFADTIDMAVSGTFSKL